MSFKPSRRLSRINATTGFVAVLMLLVLNIADVHVRYCFDGQEPAVSLHFENLSGHNEHLEQSEDHQENDLANNDVESEIRVNAVLKKKVDSNHLYLLSVLPSYFLIQETPQFPIAVSYQFSIPQNPDVVLPPLRAPPVVV